MQSLRNSRVQRTFSRSRARSFEEPKRGMHLRSTGHYSETEMPSFGYSESVNLEDDTLKNKSGIAKPMKNILRSTTFDKILSVVVVVNFCLVVLETDYCSDSDDGTHCVVPFGLTVLDYGILLLFLVELIARMYVEGWNFWTGNGWNVFDFGVIFADVVFNILEIWIGKIINFSILRIFRVLRLVRLVRYFPELHLLVAGLLGSLKAIVWGSLLLFVVVLVFSILAVQFIHPLNKELPEAGLYQGCERCSRAYATVFQSALTLTQQIIAGDSWGATTIPVIEAYPATTPFFISAYLFIGMTLLNLITGVVVTIAEQAREKLKNKMEDEALFLRVGAHYDMMRICNDMDSNSDGMVNKSEFYGGYANNNYLREVLDELEVKEADLEILWTILDGKKNGSVAIKDFVTQVFKMKSSDTHYMLTYIKYYITVIKDKLSEDMLLITKRLEKDVEQAVAEMEDFTICTSNLLPNAHVPIGLAPCQRSGQWNGCMPREQPMEQLMNEKQEGASQRSKSVEAFDDLIEEVNKKQKELIASIHQMDVKLGACLSTHRTPNAFGDAYSLRNSAKGIIVPTNLQGGGKSLQFI